MPSQVATSLLNMRFVQTLPLPYLESKLASIPRDVFDDVSKIGMNHVVLNHDPRIPGIAIAKQPNFLHVVQFPPPAPLNNPLTFSFADIKNFGISWNILSRLQPNHRTIIYAIAIEENYEKFMIGLLDRNLYSEPIKIKDYENIHTQIEKLVKNTQRQVEHLQKALKSHSHLGQNRIALSIRRLSILISALLLTINTEW